MLKNVESAARPGVNNAAKLCSRQVGLSYFVYTHISLKLLAYT